MHINSSVSEWMKAKTALLEAKYAAALQQQDEEHTEELTQLTERQDNRTHTFAVMPNRERGCPGDAAECGVECTGCKGATRTGQTSTAAEVCRCAQRDGVKGKQTAHMATHIRA